MSLFSLTWIAMIFMSIFFIAMSIIFRKIASKNFTHFAIAGGTLPFVLLLFTDIATIMGVGNFVGHSSKGYEIGLANIPFVVGEQGAKVVFALIFAGFAAKFTYNTIAELMHDLLLRDKITRALVALLTSSIMIAWVGGQAKGMGALFSVFTGADPTMMIVIFSGVFILYTIIGGMYSVVWTDLIQGALLILMAVWVYIKVFAKVNFSFSELKTRLNDVGAGHLAEMTLPFGEVFALFLTGMLGVLAAQVYWQRCFAAEKPKDASRAMFYSGIAAIVLTCIATLSGLVAKATNPNLDAGNAISWLILEEMTIIVALGFFILIYLAAISSASSLLHSAAIVMTNDLLMPNTKAKDDRFYIKFTRWCILVVGIFSVGAAVWAESIIGLFSLAYTMAGGGVIPVLMIGLLWKRQRHQAFEMGTQNSAISIWGGRIGVISGAIISLTLSILWGVIISTVLTLIFSLLIPSNRDPEDTDETVVKPT